MVLKCKVILTAKVKLSRSCNSAHMRCKLHYLASREANKTYSHICLYAMVYHTHPVTVQCREGNPHKFMILRRFSDFSKKWIC